MADADNKPTEAQTTAANEAEAARWQDDFPEENLAVPYKKEVEDDKKPDASGSDDSASDDSKEKVSAESGDTDEYEAPAPAVTVQDPGEYQPADYSFEVTLKDGKTTKVTTQEEAEKIADDPDNFETPKQLMDFINKQNKMNRNLDRDREKYDKDKQQFDEQVKSEQERLEVVNNYAAEFDYLVGKGLLPAVDKQYLDADWSDAAVADQPGVKEQIALLSYMNKENTARTKAKVRPLTSIIDAYNAWKLENSGKEAEDERRAAGEQRKAASSRVAASSPAPQGSFVPKGIAVGNPNAFKRSQSVWDD